MSRQMNVLLVEDNTLDAIMIQRALSKVAPTATITHATDGLDALEVLRSDKLRHPYFVLLDINMPRMNGHEFLRTVRHADRESDCMVFMFTTSDSPRDIARAYGERVNGYIIKPHNREGMNKILGALQAFWNVCETPILKDCATAVDGTG